jgi:hypothetical protein
LYLFKPKKKYFTGALKNTFRDIANATTKDSFQNGLDYLSQLNPEAAKYLSRIPPELYAMYPIHENPVQLLMTTTSNDAEQEFMRMKRKKIRDSETPLEFFMRVVDFWDEFLAECLKTTREIKSKNLFITPYATNQLREKMELSKLFTISVDGDSVYLDVTPQERKNYLKHHTKFRNTNKNSIHRFKYKCNIDGTCICSKAKQFSGMFCEHVIALRRAKNLLSVGILKDGTDSIWRGKTFLECFPSFSKIVKPDINSLQFDAKTIKVKVPKKRGRPKDNHRFQKSWPNKAEETKVSYKKRRKMIQMHYDTLQPDEDIVNAP